MQIISTKEHNYENLINKACSILNQGGVVIYPTETFYGIAARGDSQEALQRVMEIKARPSEKTFPLIIGNIGQLDMVATCNATERLIINKCWPGPLTILFKAKAQLSPLIQSEGRVAVRLSSNKIARDIALAAQCPITATSANLSSMPPAQDAQKAHAYFKNSIDLIIDNGRTQGGLPSTIITVHEGKIEIVRKGAFDFEPFCRNIGMPVYYR